MNTTTPRPTPETDALAVVCYGEGGIEASHGFRAVPIKDCRKLERERDEAREDTPWHSNGETKDEWFARQREKYAVIERERDEARDQLKAMREAIKEAHTELSKLLDTINNSRGVAGWHLNGNIATWDEFEINPAATITKLQPFLAHE